MNSDIFLSYVSHYSQNKKIMWTSKFVAFWLVGSEVCFIACINDTSILLPFRTWFKYMVSFFLLHNFDNHTVLIIIVILMKQVLFGTMHSDISYSWSFVVCKWFLYNNLGYKKGVLVKIIHMKNSHLPTIWSGNCPILSFK